jgi:hypothetical protein
LFCFPCENRIPKTGVSTLRLIFVILPGRKTIQQREEEAVWTIWLNPDSSRLASRQRQRRKTDSNRIASLARLCVHEPKSQSIWFCVFCKRRRLLFLLYTHIFLFHHILPNSFSLCSTIFHLFCAQDDGPEREDSARK